MSLAIVTVPELPQYVESRIIRRLGNKPLIKTGTLLDDLFEFFCDNPDEELFASDIAVKFDVPKGAIVTRLAAGVRNGYVCCVIANQQDASGHTSLQHLYTAGKYR